MDSKHASKTRLIWLDVLRAAAIFMVIGSHLGTPPSGSSPWLINSIAFLHAYGQYGVDLFFVLSGFLVSGLLFREYQRFGTVRIGRFLMRRGLKLYPAFYVFLILTMSLRLFLGDQIGFWNFLAEVCFVQNYFQGVWTHTWSLAVEEHFYIGLALVIAYLASRVWSDPFVVIVWMFLVATCVVFAVRYKLGASFDYAVRTHRFPTHLQFDSLMFGAVLSYFFTFRPAFRVLLSTWRSVLLVASALLLTLFLSLDGIWQYTLGHVVLYLGFGTVVLVAAAARATTTGPIVVFLAFVGAHSYSIYLWHTAVLVFGRMAAARFVKFEVDWLLTTIIYISAAVAWGICAAKLVEMPVLKIRDRLFPTRTPNLSPASTTSRVSEPKQDPKKDFVGNCARGEEL